MELHDDILGGSSCACPWSLTLEQSWKNLGWEILPLRLLLRIIHKVLNKNHKRMISDPKFSQTLFQPKLQEKVGDDLPNYIIM